MTGNDEVQVEKVVVTPEVASQMLRSNTGNRPVNRRHVQRLSREMSAGRWRFNGDTICFNGSRLIDGQHRLHAVVQSGVSVPMLVVNGLDWGVFYTKDEGMRRSAGHTLSVMQESNCKSLAAALAVVDRYLTGRMESRVHYSNAETVLLLEEHPQIRESVKAFPKGGGLVAPSTASALHYLFSRIDREQADRFMCDLLKGSRLDENDPVYLLRERLIKNTVSKAKLDQVYIFAIAVKAWNARRKGKTAQFLRWRDSGSAPEPFPLIE